MVRPEVITLRGGPGAIVGRVLQTSFLGSFVRVAVETPSSDGPVVVALREAANMPSIGDEVSLSWPAADGIVLEPPE